ncbi:MAG: hypothetical protein ABEI54_05290 [Candidatus Bipolaricaulia bacterium]
MPSNLKLNQNLKDQLREAGALHLPDVTVTAQKLEEEGPREALDCDTQMFVDGNEWRPVKIQTEVSAQKGDLGKFLVTVETGVYSFNQIDGPEAMPLVERLINGEKPEPRLPNISPPHITLVSVDAEGKAEAEGSLVIKDSLLLDPIQEFDTLVFVNDRPWDVRNLRVAFDPGSVVSVRMTFLVNSFNSTNSQVKT